MHGEEIRTIRTSRVHAAEERPARASIRDASHLATQCRAFVLSRVVMCTRLPGRPAAVCPRDLQDGAANHLPCCVSLWRARVRAGRGCCPLAALRGFHRTLARLRAACSVAALEHRPRRANGSTVREAAPPIRTCRRVLLTRCL